MKTITISFASKYAERVGKLLHSLNIKILMTWTSEDFMDETILCVLKISEESDSIPGSLQMEKIRENNFIKITKQ